MKKEEKEEETILFKKKTQKFIININYCRYIQQIFKILTD